MLNAESNSTKLPISRIRTWKEFARVVRSRGCTLLTRLDDFPESVLVTGCQRSGTTMLSRILTQSEGMVNYWFGPDDELDAALILSGAVAHTPRGRYCFQTTYLNECVHEYYAHDNGHKILWVMRNPFSVIYSMLDNWGDFALNELFRSCAVDLLEERDRKLYSRFGVWGISRLKRACLAYCGKVSQLPVLHKNLEAGRLLAIDYEVLVKNKQNVLPEIYRFIDLPYDPRYADMIHGKSLAKQNSLSGKDRAVVEATCMSVYGEASKLVGWR